MSKKHNTKHPNRGLSNYPERLRKRGLHKAPMMASLAELKKRQKAPVQSGEHAGWDFAEVMNGAD